MGADKNELYPILVADVADEESRAVIRAAATRRGVLYVPLLSAPVDRRRHLLEVYVQGGDSEVFLVEPAGAPNAGGFPLRLEPYGGPEDTAIDPAPLETEAPAEGMAHETEPSSLLRTAQRTKPTLSRQHARELAASSLGKEPLLTCIGRHLGRGKYRIDALIGEGGMGAVYRGHHRDLDREVAIKILHPRFHSDIEFSKRFHAEAQTMSKIDHPNVTRVLDFGEEDDGLLYLAMQFLNGVDLATVLHRDGPLELERLVNIIVQVTAGLGHVHRHAIIHRDVKPRNIVLITDLDEDHETPTEIVKVCDFGIALTTGTMEGSAGTPAYMSPEQVEGLALDARSDVYATGVLMYQLATGHLPFSGAHSTEIKRQQVWKSPEPPSRHLASIDPLLEAIIMKALSKDPGERQQSMRHLRAELRELLAPAVVAMDPGSDQSMPVSMPPDLLQVTPPLSELAALPPSLPPLPPPTSLVPPLPPAPELDIWPTPDAQREVKPAPVSAGVDTSDPDLGMWLESGRTAYGSFFTPSTTATPASPSAPSTPAAREVDAAWLAELVATHDIAAFQEGIKALQAPVGKLLERGNAAALAAVIVAMRTVIKQDPTAPRARQAGSILKSLRDPPRLTPFVDAALGGAEEPSPALQRILLETQAAGADALCAGRRRHTSGPSRTRFMSLINALGPAALPALAAALRACLARQERAGDLVEDLLTAMPAVADENAGTAVADLLRGGPAPSTTSAALKVLAPLWGERARPLLLGALGHPHPSVAFAAVAGLRVLRTIDSRVVNRLEGIVTGLAPASDELRVVAILAVSEAMPEARDEAAAIMQRAFGPARMDPRTNPLLTVSIGRALLALGAPNAAAMIADRAANSPEPLRRMLAALVPAR